MKVPAKSRISLRAIRYGYSGQRQKIRSASEAAEPLARVGHQALMQGSITIAAAGQQTQKSPHRAGFSGFLTFSESYIW